MNSLTNSIRVRRADDRGHTGLGWLVSRHSFSFGEYRDPDYMGYRSLRVINDDRVAPGKGFGTHPHRSMEIISYVVEGSLAHQDSMGNGRTIGEGQFQYMSAGSGVLHSEFNPSESETAHFLQIWIHPSSAGGEPRYSEKDANLVKKEDTLVLFASESGRDDSIAIRQQAEIHFGRLGAGKSLAVPDDPGHPYSWMHVIRGTVEVMEETLEPGDGAAIESPGFTITASEPAEFLLFRLA